MDIGEGGRRRRGISRSAAGRCLIRGRRCSCSSLSRRSGSSLRWRRRGYGWFHYDALSLDVEDSFVRVIMLLDTWGYLAVFAFVAVESSGIPFPGETMLVTAAIYAGSGHLSIAGVITAAAIGAIIGDNLGYAAGRFGGRTLVERYGKYVRLRPEHLERAERFFEKYGDRTVFFGRFIAVLRAWAAFLAGTNRSERWHVAPTFQEADGSLSDA